MTLHRLALFDTACQFRVASFVNNHILNLTKDIVYFGDHRLQVSDKPLLTRVSARDVLIAHETGFWSEQHASVFSMT